jgi:hypothetical protein
MILVASRNELRGVELFDFRWDQVTQRPQCSTPSVKTGAPGIHPVQRDELRGLRLVKQWVRFANVNARTATMAARTPHCGRYQSARSLPSGEIDRGGRCQYGR